MFTRGYESPCASKDDFTFLARNSSHRVLGVSRLVPATVAPSVVAQARPKKCPVCFPRSTATALTSCLVFLAESLLYHPGHCKNFLEAVIIAQFLCKYCFDSMAICFSICGTGMATICQRCDCMDGAELELVWHCYANGEVMCDGPSCGSQHSSLDGLALTSTFFFCS